LGEAEFGGHVDEFHGVGVEEGEGGGLVVGVELFADYCF